MVRQVHAARVGGDLAALCRLFADQGRFEIVGASADKPIAIRTTSIAELRPWLAMMVKVFRLSDYRLVSPGGRMAACHRALAQRHLFQGDRGHRAHRTDRSLGIE